jgi:hypothetical protein
MSSSWKRTREADAFGFGPTALGRDLGRRVRRARRGMPIVGSAPRGADEALISAARYAEECAAMYEQAPLDDPSFWELRALAIDAEGKRLVMRLAVLGRP